jgi:hypothetical protein
VVIANAVYKAIARNRQAAKEAKLLDA